MINEDEVDKILYNKFDTIENVTEEKSEKIKEIIHTALYSNSEKKTKEYNSIVKIIGTACASIILTVGMVYAANVVSNKVWKQPEKYVGAINITEEEKEESMPKGEAKVRAKEILKKFGCENEKIKTMDLENNAGNYNIAWHIETDKGTAVYLDAKGTKSFDIMIDKALLKQTEKFKTTEKKAEQIARELCKKYGYDVEQYKDVKVSGSGQIDDGNGSWINDEKSSGMWNVKFCKEYSEVANRYQSIEIQFIPEVNAIYYFAVEDKNYDNNSVQITEEQAKQKALEAEQKINVKYKIVNTTVKLGIREMNGDAYKRINDYEQYYEEYHKGDYSTNQIITYRTDTTVRKVWLVTIEYDVQQYVNNNEYSPFDRYYTYYVDATTGEIIGGISIDMR